MKIERNNLTEKMKTEYNQSFDTKNLISFLYNAIHFEKDKLQQDGTYKIYCDIIYALNKMEEIIDSQQCELNNIIILKRELKNFLQ